MKILINLPNLIFLWLLSSCINTEEKTTIVHPSKKIVEYQVNVIDFDLEIVYKVTCETFEKNFKEKFESTTIRDTVKTKKLQEILNDLKEDPEMYHPDVRGQLLITYEDNTIDTLCVSNFGLELNGRPMIHDERVMQLIHD